MELFVGFRDRRRFAAGHRVERVPDADEHPEELDAGQRPAEGHQLRPGLHVAVGSDLRNGKFF